MPVNAEQQESARRMWQAGRWDKVADYIASAGPPLLDAVGITTATRLLDVGAGSGGAIAIPAAQRGATVVASDLTAAHFEAGRQRAAQADVDIEWVEADVLELPFENESFDRVCSTFGHMFAPDHMLAASEMVRVCRPGGMIGFCCWTPEGIIGQMFRTVASHMPPPPAGFEPPPLWGSEDHVRTLLEPHGLQLVFERRMNVFEHESVDDYNSHMEANFGPLVTAKEALGDRWLALRSDLDQLFRTANIADDGSMRFEGEYLQTVARKPS